MDNNEYIERKNRVRKLETEILDMCMDMNYAESAHIHDIKTKLYQIEADCMAIGEFYQACGAKEEIDSTYRKVLEAQESAIKQNVENDNRRTEIAEEQVKNQIRGIELQTKLQKNADESELKTLKHRETIEKQNQHMLTALESIAYSLAKIQVRLYNEQDIIGVANPTSINNEVENKDKKTDIECMIDALDHLSKDDIEKVFTLFANENKNSDKENLYNKYSHLDDEVTNEEYLSKKLHEEYLNKKFKCFVAVKPDWDCNLDYYLMLNRFDGTRIGHIKSGQVVLYEDNRIARLILKTWKYCNFPVYDPGGNRIGCISDMKFAKHVTPEEVDKQFEKDTEPFAKDDDSDKIYLYDDLMRPVAVVLERSIKDLENKNMSSERYIKLIDTNLEHDEDYHNHGINVYNDKHDDIGVIRNGKLYPHARIIG